MKPKGFLALILALLPAALVHGGPVEETLKSVVLVRTTRGRRLPGSASSDSCLKRTAHAYFPSS